MPQLRQLDIGFNDSLKDDDLVHLEKLTQVENEIVERTKDAERLEEIPSVLERLENVDFSMLEIEGKKVEAALLDRKAKGPVHYRSLKSSEMSR